MLWKFKFTTIDGRLCAYTPIASSVIFTKWLGEVDKAEAELAEERAMFAVAKEVNVIVANERDSALVKIKELEARLVERIKYYRENGEVGGYYSSIAEVLEAIKDPEASSKQKAKVKPE
jgi:hypothetical protein